MSGAVAEEGAFDARTRRAVAPAVGNVDGCDHCQAAHTLGATGAGFTEAQTLELRRGELAEDDELTALLQVVRSAAGSVGEVDDDTSAAAHAAGC